MARGVKGSGKASGGDPLAQLVAFDQEKVALAGRERETRRAAAEMLGGELLASVENPGDLPVLSELVREIQKHGAAPSLARLRNAPGA